MRKRAFTLAEVMVAIAFISIALFAYVSLQIRLMYSTFKLEVHQMKCEQAGSALATAAGSGRTSTPAPAANLPAGLSHDAQTQTWTDRNGSHTYTIDTYVRPELPGW
ncbi:MAG TPA: type II secretion system protein [Candidatus Xenobia bacterium]|jgi:prepilin-type N-terminal cleavage/methylation domain-containing protein